MGNQDVSVRRCGIARNREHSKMALDTGWINRFETEDLTAKTDNIDERNTVVFPSHLRTNLYCADPVNCDMFCTLLLIQLLIGRYDQLMKQMHPPLFSCDNPRMYSLLTISDMTPRSGKRVYKSYLSAITEPCFTEAAMHVNFCRVPINPGTAHFRNRLLAPFHLSLFSSAIYQSQQQRQKTRLTVDFAEIVTSAILAPEQ